MTTPERIEHDRLAKLPESEWTPEVYQRMKELTGLDVGPMSYKDNPNLWADAHAAAEAAYKWELQNE